MELTLDERQHAEQNVPVDVIQKVQRCQQAKHEQRTRGALHLLSTSFVIVRSRGTGPTSFNNGPNATPWTKNSANQRPFWSCGAHDIPEHAIHYVLLKDAEIPVTRKIFL